MTHLTQDKREGSTPEKTTLDVNGIMRILPHRHPFLFLDRVLELRPREHLVAIKNMSVDEGVLTGHFPHRPVFPGILIVEAIAQAAGVLLLSGEKDRTNLLVFLTGIERAKLMRPVVPGDQLRLVVDATAWRSNAIRVEGMAYVGDQRAALATMTCAFRRAGGEEM